MAVITLYVIAAVLAFPLALFIMLGAGNLGLHLDYWGAYPIAIALIASRNSISIK